MVKTNQTTNKGEQKMNKQPEFVAYECIGCKARVPFTTEKETREEARTCPKCKQKKGFIGIYK